MVRAFVVVSDGLELLLVAEELLVRGERGATDGSGLGSGPVVAIGGVVVGAPPSSEPALFEDVVGVVGVGPLVKGFVSVEPVAGSAVLETEALVCGVLGPPVLGSAPVVLDPVAVVGPVVVVVLDPVVVVGLVGPALMLGTVLLVGIGVVGVGRVGVERVGVDGAVGVAVVEVVTVEVIVVGAVVAPAAAATSRFAVGAAARVVVVVAAAADVPSGASVGVLFAGGAVTSGAGGEVVPVPWRTW